MGLSARRGRGVKPLLNLPYSVRSPRQRSAQERKSEVCS